MSKIELLAPAGDMEKLISAINYGADAVYIGGMNYGLRAKAKNFDKDNMLTAVNYVHKFNKKIYVTVNAIPHNKDFLGMKDYFLYLSEIKVDALIIADPGVLMIAKETVPDMEIHISTQANNTNYNSANFWHKQGAKRVVMARELSLEEISEIRKKTDTKLQIEAFVHGAMCISYSGRCLLSNYMTNRDANRGECAQACRWNYHLMEEKRPGEFMPVYEDDNGTYIFNSRDLCMIEHIDELIESGIYSFKIEGRMKSSFYVATIVKAYREAIDDYYADKNLYKKKRSYYFDEVRKTSHRDFTTGFYFNKPTGAEQIYTHNSYNRYYDFIALVLDYDEKTNLAKIEQRNKFVIGDELEIMRKNKEPHTFKITEIYDKNMQKREDAPHPQEILYIKLNIKVNPYDMIRKTVNKMPTIETKI